MTAAWAKVRTGVGVHPLACHALDTTAVARLVFELLLGPRVRAELAAAFAPLGDAVGWIAVLCGLHDLGKYSPAFQALRSEVAEELLGEAAAGIRWWGPYRHISRTDTPHGLITEIDLRVLLEQWGASREVALVTSAAVGGHHGYFGLPGALEDAVARVNDHGQAEWAGWRAELVDEVVRLSGLPIASARDWAQVRLDVGPALALAALASVSDWIASDVTNFPYAGTNVDLVRYVRVAAENAVAAVQRLGWESWTPPVDTSYGALFPHDAEPRPIQRAVAELSTGLREPALVVVEAPTGEGKTKAALQFALSLIRSQGLAGIYVGMPTRATSNQMRDVIIETLGELGAGQAVQLSHGTAADYLERPTRPVDIGDDTPGESDVRAQEWFTRKRNLLAPWGVGTVDQALKASIRSGHVFVRLAGLSNKVVVLDEIHAYDIYTDTLLDRLLSWLGRLGVPVVLLSATLPAGRRRELIAAWRAGVPGRPVRDALEADGTIGYPRATLAVVGAPTRVISTRSSELNRDRVVRLEPIADGDVVTWVLERVRLGGCVAVVHNLVRRVTDTVKSLELAIAELPEAERPELICVTGRQDAAERQKNELRLRQAFGPDATRPIRAVVVGTQVLEQSLDLDFDAMVSDLAPMDALIQRVGRVHRHDRDPARGEPVLRIAGVTDGPDGPVFPPYLVSVYQPMVLLRTWALLRERAELRCPEQVPGLVNAVYGPPEAIRCPEGWEQRWQQAAERLTAALRHDRNLAAALYLPAPGNLERLGELTERPRNPGLTRRPRGQAR